MFWPFTSLEYGTSVFGIFGALGTDSGLSIFDKKNEAMGSQQTVVSIKGLLIARFNRR